jgi:large subunit ribosomal protein L20
MIHPALPFETQGTNPANRARQRFTGACRPIRPGIFGAVSTNRKQTRCRTHVFSRPRNPSCFPQKKEKPMARVKRGTKRRARRKKYLKRTKGFFLTKSKLYQSAQEAANRADRYAKRDRRVKKREYRKLWIQRVGAAARQNGLTYGQLIHGLKVAGVALDRKVLADLAVKDAAAFTSLVATAKAAAPPQAKAKKA